MLNAVQFVSLEHIQ